MQKLLVVWYGPAHMISQTAVYNHTWNINVSAEGEGKSK